MKSFRESLTPLNFENETSVKITTLQLLVPLLPLISSLMKLTSYSYPWLSVEIFIYFFKILSIISYIFVCLFVLFLVFLPMKFLLNIFLSNSIAQVITEILTNSIVCRNLPQWVKKKNISYISSSLTFESNTDLRICGSKKQTSRMHKRVD